MDWILPNNESKYSTLSCFKCSSTSTKGSRWACLLICFKEREKAKEILWYFSLCFMGHWGTDVSKDCLRFLYHINCLFLFKAILPHADFFFSCRKYFQMIPCTVPQPVFHMFREMSFLWIANPLKPLIHIQCLPKLLALGQCSLTHNYNKKPNLFETPRFSSP